MAPIRDQFFILNKKPWSESSWILRVFSLKEGPCGLIVKGARRKKSPFAGQIEVGFLVEGQWRVKVKGLAVLEEAHVLESFPNLRRSLEAFYMMNVLLETTLRGTQENHPQSEIFALLSKAIYWLEKKGTGLIPPYFYTRFLLNFCSQQGWEIQGDWCIKCQGTLAGMGQFFVKEDGGFLCGNCQPEFISAEDQSLWAEIQNLRGEKLSLLNWNGVENRILQYLEYHLEKDFKLNSLQAYRILRKP